MISKVKMQEKIQKFCMHTPTLTLTPFSAGVLKTLDRNTHDARRGAVKVLLLTGTYLVQSNKFNQYQVDPWYLLCRCSTEDYQHMILECSAL